VGRAQQPVPTKPGGQTPKPPPDEFGALVKEVTEAYKAPHEVDKDVLDELRKQYRDPTPGRETKIFREIRRLYPTTPDHEQTILAELRRAYERPSAEQEERLFREIRRNGTLPPGTVPVSAQFEQAKKLFARFDQNGDGALDTDEMPDGLFKDWRRWDRNRDGVIDFDEYGAYYRGHLNWVSERVVAGEIVLKLPKGVTGPTPPVPPQPPAEKGPPALPAWFAGLDTNRDGQIGLYEWRAAGRPIAEFLAMDLDGDGLLTPAEYLRFVRQRRAEELAAEGKTQKPAVGPDSKGRGK
jgi:hypothetical protein